MQDNIRDAPTVIMLKDGTEASCPVMNEYCDEIMEA